MENPRMNTGRSFFQPLLLAAAAATAAFVATAQMAAAAPVDQRSTATPVDQRSTATPAAPTDAGSSLVSIDARPLTPAAAPADEYFGRQKLSNLGIRNIIHAFAVEGNSPLALPLERSRIEAVDSAIIDWGEKYPRDPWLPRATINFARVLASKNDVSTTTIAIDLLLRASQRYRNTKYEQLTLAQVRSIKVPSGVDLTSVPFSPPGYDETVWLQLH